MALTRARVVAGPPALREAIEKTIVEVLTRPRDPARRSPPTCATCAPASRRRRARRRHLEHQAGARRPDRSGVHRPVSATDRRVAGAGGAGSEHGRRVSQACPRRGCSRPPTRMCSDEALDALSQPQPDLAAVPGWAVRSGPGAGRAEGAAGGGGGRARLPPPGGAVARRLAEAARLFDVIIPA